MTKLLEAAIAKVRELSEDEQDAAADALFAHIAGDHRCYELTPEQVGDVQRIQQDLRAGRTRLATDTDNGGVLEKTRPMKVRFALEAQAHIAAIHAYINERNPLAAGRVVARVRAASERLREMPYIGRTGAPLPKLANGS